MLPFEESFRIVRVSIMILMIIVGFCCIFFAYYYVRKALRFINKIEDLGKEYSARIKVIDLRTKEALAWIPVDVWWGHCSLCYPCNWNTAWAYAF